MPPRIDPLGHRNNHEHLFCRSTTLHNTPELGRKLVFSLFSEPLNAFNANNQRINRIITGILTGSILGLKECLSLQNRRFGRSFCPYGGSIPMRQSVPNCMSNCISNPVFRTKRARFVPLPNSLFDPPETSLSHLHLAAGLTPVPSAGSLVRICVQHSLLPRSADHPAQCLRCRKRLIPRLMPHPGYIIPPRT